MRPGKVIVIRHLGITTARLVDNRVESYIAGWEADESITHRIDLELGHITYAQ